jgi:hypothetical protein
VDTTTWEAAVPATANTEISAFTRYREGDSAAFDEVVAEYASPAYGVALKVLTDPSLA